MTILLTGGSGCGKSAYAERLIASLPDERRVYIATMRVADEESVLRVRRHVERRAGMRFRTVEQPLALGKAPVEPGSVVLLEDLPNLLANEMYGGGNWRRIVPDLAALAARSAHLVVVTNDVFSDGVAYDPSTQAYMRRLAAINRAAAALADYAAEVVYSIPVTLKGEAPCI